MEAEALQIFNPAFLTLFISSQQELSQSPSFNSLVIVQIYQYSSIRLICPEVLYSVLWQTDLIHQTTVVIVMDEQILLRIQLVP